MKSEPKIRADNNDASFEVELEFDGALGSDFDEVEERLLAIYDFILNYEKKKIKGKK